MQLASMLAILILSSFPTTAQYFRQIRYVIADGFTLYSPYCAHAHCYTFNQYAQQAAMYFTPGSTFLFLPGNHTVRSTLQLTAISNVVFAKKEHDSDVYIICRDMDSTISLERASNVRIEGLSFILRNRYLLQTV